MSKLGKLTGYPTSALTGIIDRMIKKRLVRRVRDEHDRRIVKVEATANGLKLARQSYRIILRNTGSILQKVDPDDREKMVSLVEKIAGSFAPEKINAVKSNW
jgi:DNA-binding MarR family transcriptional regulator